MYLQLSLRTTDGVGGGKSWDYQYPLTTNWLLSPHHHHHQHLTPGYATTTTTELVKTHHRHCPGIWEKHTFSSVIQREQERTQNRKTEKHAFTLVIQDQEERTYNSHSVLPA